METRNTGAIFVIAMIVFSGTALWKQSDDSTVRQTEDAGLHQSLSLQSSRLVAQEDDDREDDNDSGEDDNGMDDNRSGLDDDGRDDNLRQENRLRETDCFSNASCLRDRERTQDEIHTLQSGATETERSLQSYLRTDLTDSERNTTDAQLSAFRNSLNTLDDDFKEALRTGSSGAIQLVKDRAVTLYNTYSSTLLSYVDPGKVDTFRTALQTIINNRINKRQLEENRRVLSNQDEDKIEWFIGRIPPSKRLDYLIRVLSRVEQLMQNIENSSMNPVRKERFLATLDEIFALIQAHIDGIGSGGTNTTPPVILSASVTGIAPNSATLQVTVDERATGYYVLLPSGTVTPTALQVKAGQNSSGQVAALRGSGPLFSGTNQFALAGLVPNTLYVVCFTAEDTNGNLQTNVRTVSFSTVLGDTSAPSISALAVDSITSSGARLSVTSNEVGTGYYVVLGSGSIVPTVVQIKAGQNGTGQTVLLHGSGMIVNGTTQLIISNLSSGTGYILYFVAEDTSGNMNTIPMNVVFTTPILADTTPPTVSSLSLTGTTSTGTTLLATMSESGTGHYVVLLSGSYIPSATQVKVGQDGLGQAALIHGFGTTIVGANQFSIMGLVANTPYIVYFTAEDTSGNIQPSVQAISVTTLSP